MKIALIQTNPKVADFKENLEDILSFARSVKDQDTDLVVFPEMSLCGYPPLDLLSFPRFEEKNAQYLEMLKNQLPHNMAVVIGLVTKAPEGSEKPWCNSVVVLENGQEIFCQSKTLLPTYDVFDEKRYFAPSQESKVFLYKGMRIGFAICEDLWWQFSDQLGVPYRRDPVAELLNKGIDILISPSASPYDTGKKDQREEIVKTLSLKHSLPIAYVNQVGGNDSLIFDGSSLVYNQYGHSIAQAPSFKPFVLFWNTEDELPILHTKTDRLEDLKNALVLGIRDYAHKSGFTKAHLGLSGGIDSAITAVLAVEALGVENVKGFGMPSRYSSDGSVSDAQLLAANLGIPLDIIPIEKPFASFIEALDPVFKVQGSVTEENIQARIRGIYLMAYSNKTGSLLLTTGNKSELSVGYCTLYGDMAGGLGVIGDLFKTEVYELSRWINRTNEIIPWNTIEKAPSAELRENQKDQDSLPPYDELDRILKGYLLDHEDAGALIQKGENPETVQRVLKLTAASEYKRWQAPPVLKVAPISFGIGRRVPLVRTFYELN